MEVKSEYSRLVSAAASLLMARPLMSECREDYGRKTISTKSVSEAMYRAKDWLRCQAIEVREAADALNTRLTAAEQERNELFDKSEKLEKERDELRAKLFLAANPEYADNVCRDHCPEVATLKAENERLAAKIADMQDDDQLTANTLIDLNRQLIAAQSASRSCCEEIRSKNPSTLCAKLGQRITNSRAANKELRQAFTAAQQSAKEQFALRVAAQEAVEIFLDSGGCLDCDVAKEQFGAVAEKMAVAGFDSIASYRCSTLADEYGDGIELSDVIANALGDSDIGRAKEELRFLSDHVYNAIREAAKEGSK